MNNKGGHNTRRARPAISCGEDAGNIMQRRRRRVAEVVLAAHIDKVDSRVGDDWSILCAQLLQPSQKT